MIKKLSPLTLLLSAMTLSAHAADRALLIGIGQYADSRANLPGIDLDIANMEQVARQLGFAPEAVKIVRDKDATQAGIENAITEQLINGVSENDRVLFYFSGHGTRVPDSSGDESDGMDEVLVAHDATQVTVDNKSTLKGVVIDDTFEQLIKKIPSKNVLVFVDSCHSGTATRSVTLNRSALGNQAKLFSKFYSYPGADRGIRVVKREAQMAEAINQPNYVSLSAAQDTEYAKASDMGSLFTLGLHRAINDAVGSNKTITPSELLKQASEYIATKIDASQVHHPNLGGDESLFTKPLFANVGTTPAPAALPRHGVTWERVAGLSTRGSRIEIKTEQSTLKNGDELKFSVDIPMDGYLNIISIDSNDQATVLFPNQYNAENQVKKGVFAFPDNAVNFSLQAQAPFGDTLIAVFVSDKPLNIYTMNPDSRDITGHFAQALAPLSAVSERAIRVVAKEPKGFYAGQLTLIVNE